MKDKIKKRISKTMSLAEWKQQDGATLVMSLLILSITMVSATALSRVILGEVRMTINTTNSLKAFYAADSAIEKALYYVKYSRETGDVNPFSDLDDQTFNVGDADFTFVQASTTIPNYTVYNIATSTSAHVDIIDPTGNLLPSIDWSPLDDPHQYQLTWTINDCFPSHASDKLEVTTFSFVDPVSDPFETSVKKDIVVCNCIFRPYDDPDYNKCGGGTAQYQPITPFIKSISDSTFYRFSFKPLDNTVTSIFFEVYGDNAGTPTLVETTANFLVIADGDYKNNGYRLTAEIPALAAISDIFSYVIFSEETFSKGF